LLKKLKQAVAKQNDEWEMRARAEDEARDEKQSIKRNEAVIEASKPKAAKAREKEEAKKAKAAAKEEDKKTKAKAKEKTKKAKALKAAEAKEKKAAEREKKKEKQAGGEWEESEEEEESVNKRPWQEWVIMDHAPDEDDASKLYFRVAMCGYPPKEGEEEEWCMRKDLLKDHAQPLIDKHIQEHANFGWPKLTDARLELTRNMCIRFQVKGSCTQSCTLAHTVKSKMSGAQETEASAKFRKIYGK
jgi:hypothetical protein